MSPLLNKICPHCGNIGQVYLSYEPLDNSWECTCYKCSCVFKIPDYEIPLEIRKRKWKYSDHVLQSNGIPQGSMPRFLNRSE